MKVLHITKDSLEGFKFEYKAFSFYWNISIYVEKRGLLNINDKYLNQLMISIVLLTIACFLRDCIESTFLKIEIISLIVVIMMIVLNVVFNRRNDKRDEGI